MLSTDLVWLCVLWAAAPSRSAAVEMMEMLNKRCQRFAASRCAALRVKKVSGHSERLDMMAKLESSRFLHAAPATRIPAMWFWWHIKPHELKSRTSVHEAATVLFKNVAELRYTPVFDHADHNGRMRVLARYAHVLEPRRALVLLRLGLYLHTRFLLVHPASKLSFEPLTRPLVARAGGRGSRAVQLAFKRAIRYTVERAAEKYGFLDQPQTVWILQELQKLAMTEL